jgi:hypothetical protein
LLPIQCLGARAISGSNAGLSLCNWHTVRVLGDLVERSNRNSVKGTVNRARVIVVSLFPAFWLVASANGLIGPASACASNKPGSAVSRCGQGKHDTANSGGLLGQSARRWSRRLNVQSGPDGLPTPVALSQLHPPHLEHIDAFSVGSRSSFGLAQCWQFRWRTALEPRAPSSVS